VRFAYRRVIGTRDIDDSRKFTMVSRLRRVNPAQITAECETTAFSVQQIDEAENRERHRVVHDGIAVEISDNVSRRRRRQISEKVRRHWPEVAAISERYVAADHKVRTAPTVDVAKVPAIVTAHAVRVSGTKLVRWTRSNHWGPAGSRTRRGAIPRLTWVRTRGSHRLNGWTTRRLAGLGPDRLNLGTTRRFTGLRRPCRASLRLGLRAGVLRQRIARRADGEDRK
jgi:hypothetical protein